ncbi:hypothetical protein [Nocardioides sp. T2.26MG-1]|uniref:hypothetical protein n=1 Tax=Nocardioides sp. T2.26MG-1 TaxID=3041166 RepID=UPI00253F9AE8|nr:hypothetical protein [Nocardioides sp. T2.26MG-1]
MISSKQSGETVELPFTLGIAVDGDATTGPTYADGATWASPPTWPETRRRRAT